MYPWICCWEKRLVVVNYEVLAKCRYALEGLIETPIVGLDPLHEITA